MKNVLSTVATASVAVILINLAACDANSDSSVSIDTVNESTVAMSTMSSQCTMGDKKMAATPEECTMDKTKMAAMTEGCTMDKTKMADMAEGCTMDKTKMAAMTEECTMDKTKMAAMAEGCTMGDKKLAAKPAGCGMEECDMGDGTSGCDMTDPKEIANCDKAACPKVVGIMEDALKSWNHYGTAQTMNRTPIGVDFLDKQKEASVTVVADIVEVCPEKGCWMVVADDKGDNKVRVTFKDYEFFVPRNAAGHKAVISGQSKLVTRDVAYLRHIAEDQGKSPEEIAKITEPVQQLEIIADKVYIQGNDLEEPNKP